MSQNVVTYTVEVNHDNSDGKLLPYLTTNLQFETGRRQNVLLVPNAALRWSPRPAQIAHESVHGSHTAAETPASKHEVVAESGAPQSRGTVWAPEGAFVRPVHVQVGLTDGMFTEVSGKAITEGMRVVTGEAKRQPAGSETQGEDKNPFMPQGNMFHRPH